MNRPPVYAARNPYTIGPMSDSSTQKKSHPSTDCWYLTGATATGKTRVGSELARQLGAEIISLDSMAIYRGMDVGTAKPTPAEQGIVAHHLIDIRDPSEEFSVAEYVAAAHQAISEIHRRGSEVLFVGGTSLYLKSLLRGLDEGPKADWEFRRAVEEEVRTVGTAALHERVRQIDPIAASQLHPNDTRRLIRALEFYKLTGQPISHHQLLFEEGRPAEACRAFVLRRPREALYTQINCRVDRMFDSGLIEEVRRLTADGRRLGRTASQAVGYCEVIDFLAGDTSFDKAVSKTKVRTRRFAKRPCTWFRSLSECRFVDVDDEEILPAIAERIVQTAGKWPA